MKCNQQRHVVEQLVESGSRWHFGLEAGSKAELLIALSLLEDARALLICNGYKDRRYIETAILARPPLSLLPPFCFLLLAPPPPPPPQSAVVRPS